MGRIANKIGEIVLRTAVLTAVTVVLLSSCDPMALKNYITTRTYGTIYVSIDTGSDSNPGTKTEPMQTIEAAIDYLENNSVEGRVNVAEGTYTYDYSSGEFIQVVEGISLYGGYNLDFSTIDVTENETIIVDLSSTGGSGQVDPNRAVEAANGITKATIIDGFTIQGGGGTYSSAVYCDNSSPTITNCKINGGNGSVRAYGILNYTADPEIINNREIFAGIAVSGNAIAICNYQVSKPLIKNNYIHGGSGRYTGGIVNQSNAEAVIDSNTIHGGSASGAANSQANGIQDVGSTSTIRNNIIFGGQSTYMSFGIACFWLCDSYICNNTIDGGTGTTQSRGIFISDLDSDYYATPIVRNNIIFSSNTGYCILELNSDGITGAQAVENNYLWDMVGTTTLYYTSSGASYDDAQLPDVGVNSRSYASGNITNTDFDPLFVDIDGTDDSVTTILDNDWHLHSDAPSGVKTGALDRSLEFTTDRDGKRRTGTGYTGWSMGAYEY